MSNKKLEVIETVEEKVEDLVETTKEQGKSFVGKAGQWLVDQDKARADKKAAKAEAKAAKKAEKENEKKIPIGVKVGIAAAAAVGIAGTVAKIVIDRHETYELDEESCIMEDAPADTEPEAEVPAVDQAES